MDIIELRKKMTAHDKMLQETYFKGSDVGCHLHFLQNVQTKEVYGGATKNRHLADMLHDLLLQASYHNAYDCMLDEKNERYRKAYTLKEELEQAFGFPVEIFHLGSNDNQPAKRPTGVTEAINNSQEVSQRATEPVYGFRGKQTTHPSEMLEKDLQENGGVSNELFNEFNYFCKQRHLTEREVSYLASRYQN